MPELDTLPLLAIRARKIADLIALAHFEGVPVPEVIGLNGFEVLDDIDWYLDRETYAAWATWLGATEVRDYPGSPYITATATAHLDKWGPVTVRISADRAAA